jgi:hypothetical protein
LVNYNLKGWIKQLFSGKPHHIIGNDPDNPYMLRWYLIPRNKYFNLYLHKFLRSDDDRALHDHPWWFISFILKGSYRELTENKVYHRNRFSFAFRKAEHKHRVILYTVHNTVFYSQFIPVWTVVLTGSKVRNWGFWCPKGFVPWQEFTDPKDSGIAGKGCGD